MINKGIFKFFFLEDSFWDGVDNIFFPIIINPKKAINQNVKSFKIVIHPEKFETSERQDRFFNKPYYINTLKNKKSFSEDEISSEALIENSLYKSFYGKNILLGSGQNNNSFSENYFILDKSLLSQEIVIPCSINTIKSILDFNTESKFFVTVYALDKNNKIISTIERKISEGNFKSYIEFEDIDFERSLTTLLKSYVQGLRLECVESENTNKVLFKISGLEHIGNNIKDLLIASNLTTNLPNSRRLSTNREEGSIKDTFINFRMQQFSGLFRLEINPLTDNFLEIDPESSQLLALMDSQYITGNLPVTLSCGLNLYSLPEPFSVNQKINLRTSLLEYKQFILDENSINIIKSVINKNRYNRSLYENILNVKAFKSIKGDNFLYRVQINLSSEFENYTSSDELFNKTLNISFDNVSKKSYFLDDNLTLNNDIEILNTPLSNILSNTSEVNLFLEDTQSYTDVSIQINNIEKIINLQDEDRSVNSRFDEGVMFNGSDFEVEDYENIRETLNLIINNSRIVIQYDPGLNIFIESFEIDVSLLRENQTIKKLGYFSDESARSDESLIRDFLKNIFIKITKNIAIENNENERIFNLGNIIVYDMLQCSIKENNPDIFVYDLNKENVLGFINNNYVTNLLNNTNLPSNVRQYIENISSQEDENIKAFVYRSINIDLMTFTKKTTESIYKSSDKTLEEKESFTLEVNSILERHNPGYPRAMFTNLIKSFFYQTNVENKIQNKRDLFILFENFTNARFQNEINDITDFIEIDEDEELGTDIETYLSDRFNIQRNTMTIDDNLYFVLSNQDIQNKKINITKKRNYKDFEFYIDLRDINNRGIKDFIKENSTITAEILFNLNFLSLVNLNPDNESTDISGFDVVTNFENFDDSNIISNTLCVLEDEIIKIKISDSIINLENFNNAYYNDMFEEYGTNNFLYADNIDKCLLLYNVYSKVSLIIDNNVFEDTIIIEPSQTSFIKIQEMFQLYKQSSPYLSSQDADYNKVFINIFSDYNRHNSPEMVFSKNKLEER